MNPLQHLPALWTVAQLPPDALNDVLLIGFDPVLPSSFSVGTAAQVTVAASALAAATVWRYRGRTAANRRRGHAPRRDRVPVGAFAHLDGVELEDPCDRVAGTYSCGDGRWVRLHTNFPHHRAGILRILECDYDRQAVATALQSWTGYGLEDAAAEDGLCATAIRRFAEWDAHPHGQAVVTQPLVKITRIGEGGSRHVQVSLARTGRRIRDLGRVKTA